jgi:hypothetical protein
LRQIMALARRTDPSTSHSAARGMEASGAAGTHRMLCLLFVRQNPGKTSAEIAVALSLDRVAPARRMRELVDAGLVKEGPKRKCGVVNKACVTWLPIAAAPVQRELFG